MIVFTILGVILILISISGLVWNSLKKSADEFDALAKDSSQKKNMLNFPITFKPLYILFIGLTFIILSDFFFWAEAGTAYAVQYPWGGDKMVATQGLKVKAWGRTIPLSYENSIKDIILKRVKNADGLYEAPRLPKDEQGIYNRVAQEWEFSDAIKANIAASVIVGVSINDDDKFLKMADRNRSESKLINGRVLPNIDAALKNTCKLMDAQEYISGKASDFDRYFKDQLENGMYLVEEYTVQQVLPQIIGDTASVRTVGGGDKNQQKKYRIKRDKNGDIMRDNTSNSLAQYGLTIIQAKVTSIDWEDSFDERLDLQKDEVAKTQLEKQEAERQYYTTKKEIAKGEAQKAAERAKLEKEQIKLTIAAETEAKVAEQNVIVERRQLEVEKLKAQSKKVAADAQYYENQKLVQAGLTPQERAKMDIEKNKDTWNAIGGMTFDGVYMIGDKGSKGGEGLLSALLGAEVAKGMKTTK